MADPFVAEIRIFPFNFAPRGWAWCDGQLMPISQNTALFSLLGTTYGGDGKSTFALPDLQGNAPMHQGQAPGMTEHFLGEMGGTATVTLQQSEMPLHPHTLQAAGEPANAQIPGPTLCLTRSFGGTAYDPTVAGIQNMAFQTAALNGGSLPHNNMMPYLTYYFNIALQGVFPPRS